MKSFWQKLLFIPLVLAVAVVPVCGEDSDAAGDATNEPAQTPRAAPAASATQNQLTTNGANNSGKPRPKKLQDSGDHTPVRIDGTGIHVGGPDPVDIGFDLRGGPGMNNGLPNPGGFGNGGIPMGAVVISIIAIIIPFACLVAIVGCFFYFRFRRNRMLHETLRQMIDKGVPIPPELIVPPGRMVRRKTWSDFRSGLVMLAVGFGAVIFLGRLGWIAVFVGLAFLITWLVEKKDNPDSNGTTIK